MPWGIVDIMSATTPMPSSLKQLDTLATWMDSRFTIPILNIRFGLDALIGLIPGVGDFTGFLVSSYMIIILAQNGASSFLLARMILNILVDALIGSIPIIGDVFDVAFKANRANLRLMQEHYQEGRHSGSAWKLILPILFLLLVVIIAIAWLSYKLVSWLYHGL